MELKLWFSFLLLHVIHVQSDPDKWLINVPKRIHAVEGSCVVIPCSYGFPVITVREKVRNGYWKKGETIVSTTLPEWILPREYKQRSQFLGNMLVHNCTMLLNGIKTTDAGSYHFRIEMPRTRKYSYIKNPVQVDVIRNPEPPTIFVHVKEKVTATCAVTHSCPTSIPVFSWSKSGRAIPRTMKLDSWQWRSVSVLTFARQRTALNHSLNCTVRYKGGKQAMRSVILTA